MSNLDNKEAALEQQQEIINHNSNLIQMTLTDMVMGIIGVVVNF